MKLLVIGIDGGDERIIRIMSMPFLQGILDEGVSLNIEEDLWSRGWVEILTGLHGRDTGAYYTKPILNEFGKFTQKFSIDDYKNNSLVTPLWKLINDIGLKVGFMNVPTTKPAPEVDGFFISGAGGGLSQKGSDVIPDGSIYPADIGEILRDMEYVFDIRFKASGIKNVDLFYNGLIEMIKKRTETYCKLNEKYLPDVGFIAYMGVCRSQYLAMSEVEALIDNKGEAQSDIQKHIKRLYKELDGNLKRLVEEVKPENIIICSDHSQSPYRKTINVNAFLKRAGFQKTRYSMGKSPRVLFKKLISKFSSSSPKSIFHETAKSLPTIIKEKMIRGKTEAFGYRYIPGIYINDAERFGGPVQNKDDIKKLVEKIILEFNSLPICKENDLKAVPYRQLYEEAFYGKLLPDIWIDHPDSMFFETSGDFIVRNKEYSPIRSLEHITRDMFTGIKGRYPIVSLPHNFGNLVKEGDTKDLTIVYKIIQRALIQ